MSKHTEGPWEVIAAEFKDDGIVAYEIKMPEAIISKANANVIAAAPDMLSAIKKAIDALNTFAGEDAKQVAQEILEAAIAKAEPTERIETRVC